MKQHPQGRANVADSRASGIWPALRRCQFALACIIGAVIALPGCRSGAPPLHFPPGAMVLKLASVSDVPTLDPAATFRGAKLSATTTAAMTLGLNMRSDYRCLFNRMSSKFRQRQQKFVQRS